MGGGGGGRERSETEIIENGELDLANKRNAILAESMKKKKTHELSPSVY